jgi:hypothetical protein
MFRVKAEVVPVTLMVSRDNIDFKFQEDSTEMQTTEIITLTNEGNSTALFNWQLPQQKCFFSVIPMEGKVKSGETLEVEITYTPEGKVRQGGDN